MPSLWSEVQLTYILIMTVCLGIFRAIDIGLHSRDLHTVQSAHSALEEKSIPWDIFQASHCSNDTSLRTQHMPKMPEQVVLSHAAQFAGHLVT